MSMEENRGGKAGGIYSPLALDPPRLTTIAHDGLVEWKKKRVEYEAQVRTRIAATNEPEKMVLLSVKDTMDRNLLLTCCEFHWGIDVNELTEERLVELLDEIIRSVKNASTPDVKGVFSANLRMDLRETDVLARVVNYYSACNEIIQKNGWVDLFAGEQGQAQKCHYLREHLRPPELSKWVEEALEFRSKETKRNPQLLFKVILEKALEQDKLHQLRKLNVRDSQGSGPSKTRNPSLKPAHTRQAMKVTEGAGKVKQTRQIALTPEVKSDKGSKTQIQCFKCGGPHYKSECPEIDEVERERIVARLQEKRDKRRGLAKAKRVVPSTEPNDSPTAWLNGQVNVPYCADSGSDHNIISRREVNRLLQADASVATRVLKSPVDSRAVGGQILTSTESVDVFVTLETAAGPVRCQDRKRFVIVESDEEELIIGKEMLSELGINVDQQLEMLASQSREDEDPWNDDPPVVGNHVPDDVKIALEELIGQARSNGFPQELEDRLRALVVKHDIWRLTLGNDPPANVPPLKLRLKPEAQPYKCHARRYSPEKSTFLETFNAQLVELGLVRANKTSRWACPAVPVRKPRSNEFRQTNDYRPVNAMTEAIVGVMPNLTVALERCSGKKCFAMFDLVKGFWQLPLDPESQEILSYMTDKAVYTPLRVPQGCCDAALHFQATLEDVLHDLLYEYLLVWIDDILAFASTPVELLDALEGMLQRINDHGLKLNPRKCQLFLTQVKWCGRVIDADGVRHDQERIDALCAIPVPATAAELQQFLCASNWMRESLPNYARTVDPLQRCLDQALQGSQKTKRAAAGISIQLTPDQVSCFSRVKEMLQQSATLAFPDPAKDLCLLTDASDLGWGLVVTQVADWSPDIPIEQQHHELLVCMGGTFRDAALNWSVIEKEAFPIAHACEHLEHLLLRPQGFHLYCDHRNIVHLFAPGKELKKHVRGKLLRWSTKLGDYRYVLEHIAGPNNVWADLISRWGGKGAGNTSHAVKRLTNRKHPRSDPQEQQQQPMPPRPLDVQDFVWPTLADIQTAQKQHSAPTEAIDNGDGILRIQDKLWIPDDKDLVQRLMIVAHCGSNGHRGVHVMQNHLKKLFWIDHLQQRAKNFCQQCLLCLHVKGGDVIPRPWSTTFKSNQRNHALHWDFISMGKSFGTCKYLLVLKDEATHFTELVPCDEPTAEVAASAMLDWHSRFGSPQIWISDQGTHFKNQVMAELNRRLKTRQEFTVAYCPWTNGTVERVNRDIVQVAKALLLEYKINRKDWPYLVPVIQASINHSPVRSLANRAPVELFTGLDCQSPLNVIVTPGNKTAIATGDITKPSIDAALATLRSSLEAMHKEAQAEKQRQTQRNKAHATTAKPASFSIGDFVLRSRVDDKRAGNKLLVTWVGPYRVVRVEAHHYVLEDLITERQVEVHPSRMKFYCDSDLNVTREILEHIASQDTIMDVKGIVNHRYNSEMEAYEVKVSWKGLEEADDSWEPMMSMLEDVPKLLQDYAAAQDDQDFQRAVLR